MAGGAGGGILIHQDVSVYLYSTFYSVLHILHRLLIQLGGGGSHGFSLKVTALWLICQPAEVSIPSVLREFCLVCS